MKICTKCQKEKADQYFYKDKRTNDHLYSACKECHKKQTVKYIKEYRKTHKNTEYMKEYRRKYHKNLKEYNKKYQREYIKNPKNRINSNMGFLVRFALKGRKAGRRWVSLVDYTIDDLMKHLEKQFDDKMTWDNYCSYWEVDHIKPRSLFKFTTEEDKKFKECWSLNNLQPLEKEENRKKSNKYE